MENKYYEGENVKCIKRFLSDFKYQTLKLNLLKISYQHSTQTYTASVLNNI